MDSFSDFRDLLLNTPPQIELGLESSKNIKFDKKPDQLIICGMGGSALSAEFLKTVFEEFKISIPICIHKDYDLPLTISKNSLIVCISHSGTTEETISAFKKALSLKLNTVAIASGGLLEKLAQKNKIPYVSISLKTIPPRLSVLYIFSALIGILANSKIIPQKTITLLKSGIKNLKIGEIEKNAYGLAENIDNKTPLIYSSGKLKSVAYFFKIAFNENTKIHAFSNIIPECQHNEIQGFSGVSSNPLFYAIFLKYKNDSKRIAKRIDIMAEMLAKRDFDFSIIKLDSKNIFEIIVLAMLYAGFASLKLAEIRNNDPMAVPLIEELKKALK